MKPERGADEFYFSSWDTFPALISVKISGWEGLTTVKGQAPFSWVFSLEMEEEFLTATMEMET